MDARLLKNVPFFSDLDDSEVEALATAVTEQSVPEGKPLIKEDDYAYELHVIQEGTAEVTRNGEKIAELGPGDVFGEAGVLEKSTRVATVTATSPMRLVTLDHWALDRLRRRIPETIERIGTKAAERAAENQG
jgi:CRP/FNR family transcriptional regulator, cyclic AMP receptor protein